MKLRTNMSAVDKCFDRREGTVEAKESEKNEGGFEWIGARQGVLGAENYLNKGKEEGMVVGSPLVK